MHQSTRFIFTIIATLLLAGSSATALAQQSRSGGLGLSLDDWDAIFGPGEPGQSLMSYETDGGQTMYVGQEDGVVDSIQINLETSESGPLSLGDAQALVESLLPNDAELEETFTAPVIAPGTYTITSELWESDWLEDRYRDDDRENFNVIYQQTGLEPLVTSIAIIVED